MPSFATDSPLDYNLKKMIVMDAIKLQCLTVQRKRMYKQERKEKIQMSIMKPTRAMMINKIQATEEQLEMKEDKEEDRTNVAEEKRIKALYRKQ